MPKHSLHDDRMEVMPLQWTIVDCRSHTAFEPYTYGNEEAMAWDAFVNMANNAVGHNTTRNLSLYNNKGELVASFNYAYHGD